MTHSESLVDPHLAAVMVCAGERCGAVEQSVLGALAPLVRRSPRAVLIKTDCLLPHHCPRGGHVCALMLQLCDASLRPIRPPATAALTAPAAYRCVEVWLETTA